MSIIYQCPVCKQALEKVDGGFDCGQKHHYDIAKEGYVNLLLANQKRTKDPGDSKFMIEHRNYFLEQGYYDGLSKEINKIIAKHLKNAGGAEVNILDAGCGEGFYLSKLKQHAAKIASFSGATSMKQFFGIDISKSAIQKAAKRDHEIQWCVGSTFNLPYLNQSMDFIFSIFAPFEPLEFARVLKPHGLILMVRPGPNHLKELVEIIYDQSQPKEITESIFKNPSFKIVEKTEVQYQIHLKNQKDIMSLVAMTPYYWHLNKAKEALLASKKELNTNLDFQIFLLQNDFSTTSA